MIKVLLTHDPFMLENFYGTKAIDGLKATADVRFNETGQVLDTAALIELTQGCDAVVLDRNTPAEAAFFDACPELISAHRCAVDIRNIDVDAASRNGVLVTNASPGFVDAVVELTLGLMVDQGRSVSTYAHAYHRGETPPASMGVQLSGATAGIIGYGEIGQRLADVLAFLGMNVLVNDPYKDVTNPAYRKVELTELLGASDFTICLAVANTETENLLDDAAFAAMKPDAYFINISRGNLVDEAALGARPDERNLARCRSRCRACRRPETLTAPCRPAECHRHAPCRRTDPGGGGIAGAGNRGTGPRRRGTPASPQRR